MDRGRRDTCFKEYIRFVLMPSLCPCVAITNQLDDGTWCDGYVIADAVKFLPVDDLELTTLTLE